MILISESSSICIFIIFLLFMGIIMIELVPEGQTIHRKYYREVIIMLGDEFGIKDRICGRTHGFYKRTTRRQLTMSVKQFSKKRRVPVLEHPLYSPDLAPSDSCFQKLKMRWMEHIINLWKRWTQKWRSCWKGWQWAAALLWTTESAYR